MTRTGLLVVTFAFSAISMGGCAAKQVPPAEGVCNPGREWVAPRQTENGGWVEGYCRDLR